MAKRSILDDPKTRALSAKAAELRRYTEAQLKRSGILSAKAIAEIIDNTDWLEEARKA